MTEQVCIRGLIATTPRQVVTESGLNVISFRLASSYRKFDPEKNKWFNHQYLLAMDPAAVAEMLMPQIQEKGFDTCKEYVEQVVVLMREKVQFAKDIVTQGIYFFAEPDSYEEEIVAKKWKENTNNHLLAIADAFSTLAENATAEAYETAFKQYCETQAVKSGELLQPLRLAVSGFGVGAPIWEMIALIGRDYIVPRIQKAVTKISFPKA